MFVKAPPPVETCHWTVGAGLPVAAAVNVAVAPALAVALAGCVDTVGAKSTVNVAALVVTLPSVFVKTARYWLPFSAAVADTDSIVDVALVIFANVEDPLGADCHCTVAAGFADAAAVNVAV